MGRFPKVFHQVSLLSLIAEIEKILQSALPIFKRKKKKKKKKKKKISYNGQTQKHWMPKATSRTCLWIVLMKRT